MRNLKANSFECRHLSPSSKDYLHKKAAELWKITGNKVLIDTTEIIENEFKQKVIQYANNKYGKG